MKYILVVCGNSRLANTAYGTLASTLPVVRTRKPKIVCDGTDYYVVAQMDAQKMRGIHWDELYVVQPDMLTSRVWRELQAQTDPETICYIWRLPGIKRETA